MHLQNISKHSKLIVNQLGFGKKMKNMLHMLQEELQKRDVGIGSQLEMATGLSPTRGKAAYPAVAIIKPARSVPKQKFTPKLQWNQVNNYADQNRTKELLKTFYQVEHSIRRPVNSAKPEPHSDWRPELYLQPERHRILEYQIPRAKCAKVLPEPQIGHRTEVNLSILPSTLDFARDLLNLGNDHEYRKKMCKSSFKFPESETEKIDSKTHSVDVCHIENESRAAGRKLAVIQPRYLKSRARILDNVFSFSGILCFLGLLLTSFVCYGYKQDEFWENLLQKLRFLFLGLDV